MKGIILAGGTGSRMAPCTLVTNKHLLPIYDKPMVYYPLLTLISGGIKEILIVSGRGHAGHFVNLLGSGRHFGVRLSYEVQEEAGGIAQALGLAKEFIEDDDMCVILGDNIFDDEIKPFVKEFESQKGGARIFLKEVSMEAAKRFGIATVEGDKVVYVEEKPKEPKSNLCMTGLYMFDNKVFDVINTLEPSGRGELEITDAIDVYRKKDQLYFNRITNFWSDAGTFKSIMRAASYMADKDKK